MLSCSLSPLLCVLLVLPWSSWAAPGIGINLGNVLDAPYEGDWAPPAQEYYFDDYKSVGFSLVRIPVRWDNHLGSSPPYLINSTFLSRVEEVVGWCVQRGFVCVINSHHDDWLDSASFDSMLPRFKALWSQVADTFSSAPSNLYFEIFNEPHVMTLDNLNRMNAEVVPIIRTTNPTRPIFLGGLSWMSPYWILSNPDAMVFPPFRNLHLEVHTYDPYNACLQNPPTQTNWGTQADQQALFQLADGMRRWSQSHSNTPVYLGEMGCLRQQPNRTARVLWYNTMARAWSPTDNIEFWSAWDDNGDFMLYNRAARTWDQEILRAMGL